MTLDRHAAERRRFARLLGVDGELGSGLPIGPSSRVPVRGREREDERERADAYSNGTHDSDDVHAANDSTAASDASPSRVGSGAGYEREDDHVQEYEHDLEGRSGPGGNSPVEKRL